MTLAPANVRPTPAPAAAFLVRQNVAENFNICNVPGPRLAGAIGASPDDLPGNVSPLRLPFS
jgi:hypothetical protein